MPGCIVLVTHIYTNIPALVNAGKCTLAHKSHSKCTTQTLRVYNNQNIENEAAAGKKERRASPILCIEWKTNTFGRVCVRMCKCECMYVSCCWRCRSRCFGVIISHRLWRHDIFVGSMCVFVLASVHVYVRVRVCVRVRVREKESQDCLLVAHTPSIWPNQYSLYIGQIQFVVYIVVGDTPLLSSVLYRKRWFSRFLVSRLVFDSVFVFF